MNIDKETGEIKQPFFKTPNNHDTDAESNRTGLACADPSKAQQSAKEETDINTIVDRFLKTGAPATGQSAADILDFAEVFDFQSAMNTVNAAKESFLALPAGVRNSFGNDLAKFVAYVDHCIETGTSISGKWA